MEPRKIVIVSEVKDGPVTPEAAASFANALQARLERAEREDPETHQSQRVAWVEVLGTTASARARMTQSPADIVIFVSITMRQEAADFLAAFPATRVIVLTGANLDEVEIVRKDWIREQAATERILLGLVS